MEQLLNSREASAAFNSLGFVYIVLGGLYCFLGYKIFRTLLFLAGAITGVLIFAAVAAAMGGEGLNGPNGGQFLLCCIGCAFVGGSLFSSLYIVGVFLLGGILGAGLGLLLTGGGGGALIVFLAIAGGILAVVFQKLIIIVATSFTGAQAIVVGFTLLGTGMSHRSVESALSMDQNSAGHTVLVLLLTAVGIFVQYKFFGIEPVKKSEKSSELPKQAVIEGQPAQS